MSPEMFPLPALSRLGQSTHTDRRAKKCSHRDSPVIVVSLMSIPYRGKELDEERWHPRRSTDGKWALPFLGQRWPHPAQARESIDSQLGSANRGLMEVGPEAGQGWRIGGGTFPRERVRVALAPRDFISLPSGLAVPEIEPRAYTRDAHSGRSDARRPANWDNAPRGERPCRKSRSVCTHGTRFLASGGWKEPPPSRITHRVYTRDGLFDRSSSRRSANSGNAVVGMHHVGNRAACVHLGRDFGQTSFASTCADDADCQRRSSDPPRGLARPMEERPFSPLSDFWAPA